MEGEELKFRVIILLTIFIGLRRGEVLGLEWQDVDFKNSSITLRQASQYVSSIGIYTKNPKTETSNRIISIPDSITKLLKDYKRKQLEPRLKLGDKWLNTNRLFVQWDGSPSIQTQLQNGLGSSYKIKTCHILHSMAYAIHMQLCLYHKD